MSTTSRFGAVIDALVTLIDATDVVRVFDGPEVTGDRPADYVVVGGTEDPGDEAGEFVQDWNGLGARNKTETGNVECALLVVLGDDGVKVARDRAFNILGQIETALRADPALTEVVRPGWVHISSGRPRQVQGPEGLYVRIAFTVSYQTNI